MTMLVEILDQSMVRWEKRGLMLQYPQCSVDYDVDRNNNDE